MIAWRTDPRIQSNLAASTKASYRRDMDAILFKNADKYVRKTQRQHVRAAHAALHVTPRKADKYLQTISLLWNFGAEKLDWPLGENPAKGIEKYGRQKNSSPGLTGWSKS